MLIRRNSGLFVIASAVVILLSSAAMGQLTSTILESSDPLNNDEMILLDAFATRMVGNLSGEKAGNVREARRDLLSPLNRRPSRTFRVAYDEVLTPKLRALLDDPEVKINKRVTVLSVLGSIASESAVNGMQKELASPHNVVRYAAAMSYARSFQAISGNRDAFVNAGDSQVRMARSLRTAIETETQSFVLHALLQAADTLPDPTLAVDSLCRGLQTQLKNGYQQGANDCIPRLAEGLLAARTQYLNMFGVENVTKEQQLLIETTVMSLRVVIEHGVTGNVPTPLQDGYFGFAVVAEQILQILCDSPNAAVSKAIKRGDYEAAEQKLEQVWLNAGGLVYGSREWNLSSQRIEQLLGP